MSKRKFIQEQQSSLDIYDLLDGKSFDDIIMLVTSMKSKYQDRDMKFSIEAYGYDGGTYIYLVETRLENDEEFAARKKIEDRIKATKAKAAATKIEKARAILLQTEQDERVEYERLKAKFEK